MIKSYILSILIFLSCSCTVEKQVSDHTDIINEYYQTYQERKNFDKFLSFYDENIILEDIVSGDRIDGIEAFKQLFDWENPDFVLTDSVALVVTNQIIDKNMVSTQGYFTSFTWSGTLIEAMQFSTILELNNKGKIVKQTDWINYPSTLIDYGNRKNSNDWLK